MDWTVALDELRLSFVCAINLKSRLRPGLVKTSWFNRLSEFQNVALNFQLWKVSQFSFRQRPKLEVISETRTPFQDECMTHPAVQLPIKSVWCDRLTKQENLSSLGQSKYDRALTTYWSQTLGGRGSAPNSQPGRAAWRCRTGRSALMGPSSRWAWRTNTKQAERVWTFHRLKSRLYFYFVTIWGYLLMNAGAAVLQSTCSWKTWTLRVCETSRKASETVQQCSSLDSPSVDFRNR